MPLAGLVLNRAAGRRRPGALRRAGEAGAQTLDELVELSAGPPDEGALLTAALLRLHAERISLAARQRHLADRFTAAHPGVPVGCVPALAEDVHDLDGLRTVGGPPRPLSLAHAELGPLAPRQDPLPLVLVLRGLQQVPPRRDVRAAAQQGAALTLGHAAPDAELDPVVEGVGETLGADHAPHADRPWRGSGRPPERTTCRDRWCGMPLGWPSRCLRSCEMSTLHLCVYGGSYALRDNRRKASK